MSETRTEIGRIKNLSNTYSSRISTFRGIASRCEHINQISHKRRQEKYSPLDTTNRIISRNLGTPCAVLVIGVQRIITRSAKRWTDPTPERCATTSSESTLPFKSIGLSTALLLVPKGLKRGVPISRPLSPLRFLIHKARLHDQKSPYNQADCNAKMNFHLPWGGGGRGRIGVLRHSSGVCVFKPPRQALGRKGWTLVSVSCDWKTWAL